jgi:hypothetical protein
LVDTLRIAASNEDEVGQIRSKRGISMKRMMNDETLYDVVRELADHGDRDKSARGRGLVTYRHSAQKMIMPMLSVKMLAMPRAKQRIIDNTPSLNGPCC